MEVGSLEIPGKFQGFPLFRTFQSPRAFGAARDACGLCYHPEADDLPTFKHYEIEDELGKGGSGVVYRARDTRLGRPVALKVLPPELTRRRGAQGAVSSGGEARGAAPHPAIAQIYDVDEGPEGLFIAMELVEGKTVKSLIAARELDLLGRRRDRDPGRAAACRRPTRPGSSTATSSPRT